MLVTRVRLHEGTVPAYGEVGKNTGVCGWYGSSLYFSSLRSFAPTPRPPMYRSQYSGPRSSVSVSWDSRSTWSMRRLMTKLPPRPTGEKAGILDNGSPMTPPSFYGPEGFAATVRVTVRLMGPYKRAAGVADDGRLDGAGAARG